MRDEIDGRLWVAHGREFTAAVAEWIGALNAAFIRMNERNYAAPWRDKSAGYRPRPN